MYLCQLLNCSLQLNTASDRQRFTAPSPAPPRTGSPLFVASTSGRPCEPHVAAPLLLLSLPSLRAAAATQPATQLPAQKTSAAYQPHRFGVIVALTALILTQLFILHSASLLLSTALSSSPLSTTPVPPRATAAAAQQRTLLHVLHLRHRLLLRGRHVACWVPRCECVTLSRNWRARPLHASEWRRSRGREKRKKRKNGRYYYSVNAMEQYYNE